MPQLKKDPASTLMNGLHDAAPRSHLLGGMNPRSIEVPLAHRRDLRRLGHDESSRSALRVIGLREAANAKEAGFDGVEIHAANGYLIDQFLKSGSNRRTDEYGGAASNRVRFLTETVESVLDVWDSGRVGVRISPTGGFNDMTDDCPRETFSAVIDRLGRYELGYLHVVETAWLQRKAL